MKTIFFIAISTILISFQSYNDKKEKTSKTNSSAIKIENTQTVKKEVDRKELVAFAESFMGVPYVYATQDPKIGFDCSGFVNYVYKNFDISVPRSSSGFKDFGKKINIEDVAIGDVLVFTGYRDTTSIGHLGIVCEADGMNSKFIHASSGKVMQVTISDLSSEHYTNRFHHAVDVIKQ